MRRRRTGRPLQRPRIPWIIACGFSTDQTRYQVPYEKNGRGRHEKRADRRDHVHPSPAGQIRIREGPARHACQSKYVLNHEGQVETDSHQPKRPFTDPLRHHSAAHFWKPIMKAAQNREDDQPDKHVMKMCDQVITVLGLPVERR